jgi:hypothetical protein
VVGVLAALELFMSRADERENEFLLKLLEKHHARLKTQFDRYVVSILMLSLCDDVLFIEFFFAIVAERANQDGRRHETH